MSEGSIETGQGSAQRLFVLSEAVGAAVREYLDGYEFGDTEDGVYTPNEFEATLIFDAVQGLLADGTVVAAINAHQDACRGADPALDQYYAWALGLAAGHADGMPGDNPFSAWNCKVGFGADPTAAARDVVAERRRQVEAEGIPAAFDDGHVRGELAQAAACYALGATFISGTPEHDLWPWDREDWKPADHRRNLVKAGALILAEIERVDRAAAKPGPG